MKSMEEKELVSKTSLIELDYVEETTNHHMMDVVSRSPPALP